MSRRFHQKLKIQAAQSARPQEKTSEEKRETYKHLFDMARERYINILQSIGQERNGLMAFKSLRHEEKVPHKVLSAPYRAFDRSPDFKVPFEKLCETLSARSLQTIQEEVQHYSVNEQDLLHFFHTKIEKNIRRNYAYLRSNYNIFEAFNTPEYPKKLSIHDVQRKITAIYEDPEIGIKAFTKRIRDVESIALTSEELAHFSTLLEHIENGPPMSESNLSKELHKFPHIDQATISALSEEYGRMVLQWDMRLVREIGVLGTPEKSMQLSDREIAKKWGEALDNVLKTIFLQIETFINELKHEYGIVEKIRGDIVHYTLPISNELRNKSPFELFRYMETASSPQESSLAQNMLMLILQYLLVDNHPHYKNAHLVNLQFDAICAYDKENFSVFYKDEETDLWKLDPDSYSKSLINEDEIEISIAQDESELEEMATNEDSNMQGGSMASAISSMITGVNPRQEFDVFWRYWLSPALKRQEFGTIPDEKGVQRPLRFHLVGRAVKSIDAILSKFHNRREHFEGIDDIVRARMVLDTTRGELENSAEVQHQVVALARDTAENVLHLANFIPNTSADRLLPNSYTIVSSFQPLTENGTQKRKKNNNSSSRLWQDMKICGRTQDGTTIEVQLLPQDVYCLDLDAESPVSHTWYEIDRLMDFIQSLLPVIYFKREHNLLGSIRTRRRQEKERMTKIWEKKMGMHAPEHVDEKL